MEVGGPWLGFWAETNTILVIRVLLDDWRKQLILTKREIQQAIEQAKTAFPHFTDWQYNNEINEGYFGFYCSAGTPITSRKYSGVEDVVDRC
ncbi:MAG: hypothetical protein MAG451_00975 [Anaerolineales bacterium]|nr:hypothetical protein [Anaerolineales bacterium]